MPQTQPESTPAALLEDAYAVIELLMLAPNTCPRCGGDAEENLEYLFNEHWRAEQPRIDRVFAAMKATRPPAAGETTP